MTETSGVPIMSPDELRARSQTIVILTNNAPDELLALAGPDRKATLLSIDPPMITLPYQKGIFKVRPEDIVFENHHSGRDVTEAGADETPYEKFFASAMKKFGVSSPIELSPDETKKFFNYVDKNWEAEEESDGSKNEILPAIGAVAGGLARGAAAVGRTAAVSALGSLGGDEDATEDVTTGKVGKKDKGSYQHAYKLALKKYQIHSADELDTPAERKGFTDYVDRLWKKGDIHRDKKEAAVDEADLDEQSRKSIQKQQRKAASSAEKEKRGQSAGQKTSAEKQKERDVAKAAADREKNQKELKRKSEQEKQRRERESAQQKNDPPTPPKPDNKPDKPPKPGKPKKKKKKKPSFMSKIKGTGLGKIAGAAQSSLAKYKTKEASIPEGVKKTPGVSKKARGAVGFAKHARKGTGAKRQFQKGVRQAGKEQARNEVLYQAPKSNKKTPETSWDKASEDKRAELLQLASPRTSTKYTKLDYRELTPMLQKAIDKVYKTKKAKLEVSPPDRKHQVKGIKKHMAQKKGKDKIPKTYVDKKTGKRKETNPWALAWAQYDKYGVPSRDEKD